NGVLSFENKFADAKTVVGRVAFDPAAHAFWRIRHVTATDQVSFETAPNTGGAPGTWTVRATIARQLSIASMYFEVKAGTWTSEANSPGTVAFDNARVAKP